VTRSSLPVIFWWCEYSRTKHSVTSVAQRVDVFITLLLPCLNSEYTTLSIWELMKKSMFSKFTHRTTHKNKLQLHFKQYDMISTAQPTIRPIEPTSIQIRTPVPWHITSISRIIKHRKPALHDLSKLCNTSEFPLLPAISYSQSYIPHKKRQKRGTSKLCQTVFHLRNVVESYGKTD